MDGTALYRVGASVLNSENHTIKSPASAKQLHSCLKSAYSGDREHSFCLIVNTCTTPWAFLHIDGRLRFAKSSINDVKQVKIAAIDPVFMPR